MQFKTLLLVILSSFLILVGCDNDNDDDNGGATGTDQPTAPNPEPNPEPHMALGTGTWGNEDIELNITRSNAHFHIDCGKGTIRGRIRPDENGNFRNRGTITFTTFDPDGREDTETFEARFRGVVNGNKTVMALTITYENADGDDVSESYVLRKGVEGPDDGQCSLEPPAPAPTGT